jgi:HSP20 family protein
MFSRKLIISLAAASFILSAPAYSQDATSVEYQFQRTFNNVMNNFANKLNNELAKDAKTQSTSFVFSAPKVDLVENDKNVILKADLPGYKKEDVKVTVYENYVELSSELKTEKQDKTETYHISERSFGSFKRVLQLPAPINIEKAETDFKDGILTITLPKKEDAKPKSRTLEIK